MAITDERTINRDFPIPVASNDLGDDVARLRTFGEMVDSDIATVLAALATKAGTSHTHTIADILGLVAALDAKANVGEGGGTGGAPLDSPDFTGAPLTTVPGNADSSRRIPTTGWVWGRLAGFSQTGHGHAISDITDLTSTLNGKMDKTGGTFSASVKFTAGATFGSTSQGAITADNSAIYVRGPTIVFQNGGGSTTFGTMDASGNLVMTGNVSAYSDETLKGEWEPLPVSMIWKLASMRSGTFKRTDLSEDAPRQVGVGAQSLEAFMPEAVATNEDGIKSVMYGNAALAAACLLAKEVVNLRAILSDFSARIKKLEGN